MVEAFEGNAAETTTMLPTIRAFMAAHQLADVTIVADAGMVFDGTVVRARNGRLEIPALLASGTRCGTGLLPLVDIQCCCSLEAAGVDRARRAAADDGYWGGCGSRTGPDAVVLVHQQPLGSGRSTARRAGAPPASLQLAGGRRQALARQCLILDGIAAVRDTLHDTNSCRLEWFPAAGVASAATVVAGGRPVGSFRVLS
jgi:hypothetical protein